MSRILHLSDLHFGAPFLPHVADAVLRFAQQVEPSLLVISGDFTQTAAVEEFEAARQFINCFAEIPSVYLPGNHDVPPLPRLLWEISDPFARYQEYIYPDLNTFQIHGPFAVAAVNTTTPWGSLLNGWISTQQ